MSEQDDQQTAGQADQSSPGQPSPDQSSTAHPFSRPTPEQAAQPPSHQPTATGWPSAQPAPMWPVAHPQAGYPQQAASAPGQPAAAGFQPQWSYDGPWAAQPGAPLAAPGAGSGGGLPRRTKVLSGAAALVLVAGAAVGGAAFGYSHAHQNSAAGIATGGIGSTQTPGGSQSGNPPSGFPTPRGNGNSSSFNGGHATSQQMSGVVDIYTKLKYQQARAAGTGMILTSDGEVLTNNHVVEGATKIKVIVVATHRTYTASVVGTDKIDDVAVLQLANASGLSTVQTSTALPSVGDAVTAVGNAMGAGGVPSAATGSVTALNQSITTQSEGGVTGEHLVGLIQVNAQVISGDSGGPLYDANNQVVGMDTAASSANGGGGVGFAIPIEKALAIAQNMTSGIGGPRIHLGAPAFLGVEFSAEQVSQSGGAKIAAVLPRTPAARAGLITGDTITSISGKAITTGTQLRTVLSTYKPGDTVSVTWSDTQGGSHTQSVQLIPGPAL